MDARRHRRGLASNQDFLRLLEGFTIEVNT